MADKGGEHRDANVPGGSRCRGTGGEMGRWAYVPTDS
jgi:hypothetical protein